jgi:hypothetical protein
MQVTMKIDCPVAGRRRKAGESVNVDDKTAHALAHLGIAEFDEPPIKRAVVFAEPIDQPRIKRAYKRRASN